MRFTCFLSCLPKGDPKKGFGFPVVSLSTPSRVPSQLKPPYRSRACCMPVCSGIRTVARPPCKENCLGDGWVLKKRSMDPPKLGFLLWLASKANQNEFPPKETHPASDRRRRRGDQFPKRESSNGCLGSLLICRGVLMSTKCRNPTRRLASPKQEACANVS